MLIVLLLFVVFIVVVVVVVGLNSHAFLHKVLQRPRIMSCEGRSTEFRPGIDSGG